MSNKVITPVGTSLFTNYIKTSDAINTDYDRIKDKTALKWPEYSAYIERIREKVKTWARKKLNRTPQEIDASAEITSLVKILEEANEDLEVYLIATDTIISQLAAEILQTVLPLIKRNGHTISVIFDLVHADAAERDVIEGLQVTDDKRFQDIGLTNLFTRIKKITNDFKDSDSTILNITGGFKGVIPYLTMIGQVYRIPQCYIFEPEADEHEKNLLHIPQFPFQLDWGIAERYLPYLLRVEEFIGYDEIIKQELQQLGLIGIKSSGKPFATAIGKIYKEFIENYLPSSPNVFGHYVEYKVLEYYLKFPYQGYRPVQRHIYWPTDQNELDIVMGNYHDSSKDFIVMEVKTYVSLIRDFEKVKRQIRNHLNAFAEVSRLPKEFHVCIHYQCGNEHAKHHLKDAIKQRLQELQQDVERFHGCTFKVWFLYIDLRYDSSRRKLNYQHFMAEALPEGAIEAYSLA